MCSHEPPQDRNIARIVVEPKDKNNNFHKMEKTFKESTKKSILIKIDELKDKVANGNLTTEQLMKIQNNIDKSLKND